MGSVLFQGRLALAGVIKPQKDQESADPGSHLTTSPVKLWAPPALGPRFSTDRVGRARV